MVDTQRHLNYNINRALPCGRRFSLLFRGYLYPLERGYIWLDILNYLHFALSLSASQDWQ